VSCFRLIICDFVYIFIYCLGHNKW